MRAKAIYSIVSEIKVCKKDGELTTRTARSVDKKILSRINYHQGSEGNLNALPSIDEEVVLSQQIPS
jgi:hypothetical protein